MSRSTLPFPPILLRASAGTGKTYALTNRFISLIAQGELPEKILATTFTRKAAAEIQERLFSRIANAAIDPDEAQQLSTAIDADSFSQADARSLLKRLIQEQHRLRICTLDSFCIEAALNFSFELGLPPGWKIVDQQEESQLIEAALMRLNSRDSQSDLLNLYRMLARGELRRDVHRSLENIVRDLHELYRESSPEAWQPEFPKKFLTATEIQKVSMGLLTLEAPLTGAKKPNKNFESALERLKKFVTDNNWHELLDNQFVKNILSNNGTYYKQQIPESYRPVVEPLAEHAIAVLLQLSEQQTRATHELLSRYERESEILRRRFQQLTFSDVKFYLRQAALLSDLSEFYFRLDSRIAHLLLDEFQDTSMAEWMVLEPMVDEILSKSGHENSFFCVGDVKQAIYGWRGGVAEIFNSLETSWPQLELQSQELSRRSAPEIIETVNKIFENLSSNTALKDFPNVVSDWAKKFKSHSTVKTEQSGYVQLQAVDISEDRQACLREAAKLVSQIQQQTPSASIGVLVRTNDAVSAVISELAGPAFNIVASEEGGNPLTDSAAVRLMLSLLKIAEHPGDTIARFHLVNSPLNASLNLKPIQDQEFYSQLGLKLRKEISLKGLGLFLHETAKPVAEQIGSRDQRRLSQLVELGFEWDRKDNSRLRDFIRRVQREKREDPFSAPVRVMTIHQAKGLEFDAVVLPELGQVLQKAYDLAVFTERPNRLSPPSRVIRNVGAVLRDYVPQINEMYQQHVSEAVNEALSLLYVALTRSRTALYLLVPENTKQESATFAGVLRSALSTNPIESNLLYQLGNSAWNISGKQPPSAISRKKSSGKISIPKKVRRLPYHRPSELEGSGQRKAAAFLRSSLDQKSQEHGIKVHAALSKIDWAEDLSLIKELTTDTGITKYLLRAFEHSEISQIFKTARYADWNLTELKVLTEHSFLLRDQQRILRGTFDRLVVGCRDGQPVFAEIIDFKTDRIASDADLEERLKFYRPQLEAYHSAAQKILNLEPSQVKTSCAFLNTGQLIKL